MSTETDNTDVQIDLVDDETKPKEPEIVVEKAEDKPKPENDVTEQLAKLKEQLESERRGRIAAEETANRFAQTAHQSKTEAQDANLHLVANAIAAVEVQTENLKAQYRQALADNDIDALADIQVAIASNAAKLAKLEDGKAALEAAPKPEAPKPMVSDAVEALASQLTPRSAAWVRAHPEFATDPVKYQKMLAAHNLVVADGVAPDTDDYFDQVEGILRIKPVAQAPAVDDATADAARVTQHRSSPPAAPVSRSGGGPGTSPNRVTLSREEREMAAMMGMSDADYAKNKLALQREGRLH